MLIGVKDTPKIAPRVCTVEVDGVEMFYAFRAMLGTGGWCEFFGLRRPCYIERCCNGDPYICRREGHARAWIYSAVGRVELTPALVTLDWEIDGHELAKVEAAIRKERA